MSFDEVVISAKGLSKCYPIYNQPKDRLKQYFLPRLRNTLGFQEKKYFKEFWALNDINFEIKRGDTVGIIGRNGAGKSTLLQVLCGTLTPTGGEYVSKGRVAALLELGSGFNPEFSGRENVYLNASILGLSRAQIDERFDSIAAFADIGEFIEQPVKTYSSGMYVRLAFAVIAHVDADILVVDEALAVGDAIFTQKCMRYIRKFQERGTLLFVSHDVASVTNLCKSAIWLEKGRVRQQGSAKVVCDEYLQYTFQEIYGKDLLLQKSSSSSNEVKADEKDISGEYSYLDQTSVVNISDNLTESNGWKTGVAEIIGVSIRRSDNDEPLMSLEGGERVTLRMDGIAASELDRPLMGFYVRDRLGQNLFGHNTLSATNNDLKVVQAGGQFHAEFDFVMPLLPNGSYSIVASLANGTQEHHEQHHWLHDALILEVVSSSVRWGLVGIPFRKISITAD